MLTFSQVTITLGDKPIIKNLSLSCNAGSIHALMGPNGSGKSTLALTVMGYPQYQVVEGTISFDSHNVCELPTEQRARLGLFLVCQQPPAVPGVPALTFLKEAHRMLTGLDVSLADFKQLAYEAFDAVHLDHSFLYRPVHEGFSGGEKKRFEIAQLLLFKPKFALLDEIDSGLDVDALRLLSEIIMKESRDRGMGLLIITHYKRLLEYVRPDFVHVLSQGTLWASSDHTLADTIDAQGYDGLFL